MATRGSSSSDAADAASVWRPCAGDVRAVASSGVVPGSCRMREAPAFTRRERHLHPTTRDTARREAPAFTRREVHLHPTRRAAHARRSPRVYAAGGSPSPYVPRHPPGSPRVHAAGASPSPYVPRTAQPGSPRVHAAGGSPSPYVPRTRQPGSPRVHAAGASPSPYAAARRHTHREAPAFTRREPHLHPTSRAHASPRSPRVHAAGASPSPYVPRTPQLGSPRVHAAGASPSPYVAAPTQLGSPRVHAAGGSPSPYASRRTRAEKPPRLRGGRLTFTLASRPHAARKPPRSRGGRLTFTLRLAPTRAEKPPRKRSLPPFWQTGQLPRLPVHPRKGRQTLFSGLVRTALSLLASTTVARHPCPHDTLRFSHELGAPTRPTLARSCLATFGLSHNCRLHLSGEVRSPAVDRQRLPQVGMFSFPRLTRSHVMSIMFGLDAIARRVRYGVSGHLRRHSQHLLQAAEEAATSSTRRAIASG